VILMSNRGRIRHAMIYGAWQAHAVVFAFMFVGWFAAILLWFNGLAALSGLVVGMVMGLVVVNHMMRWPRG
jgi:hypothetical protein